ncbi:MAG: glycosyltransferase [Actinomycetota bacterium]
MRRLSVVMPAHNEAAVIDRSLRTLLADAVPGEFDVVVVCNGCSDDTASIARAAAPQAHVIELDAASKSAALNVGDAAATAYPRFYLDADICVTAADLRTLADALDGGDRLAIAATVAHRWRQSRSWPVRSYYRLWSGLPAGSAGIFGTGVIGLTAAGRGRFDQWPDVVADDYYCDSLFTPAEKMRHPDVHVQLDVPGRLPALVRRKARVRNGNLQIRGEFAPTAKAAPPSSLRDVVRRRPGLILDVPAFLLVTLAARALAARDRRSGRQAQWRRDDSRLAPKPPR